MASWGDVIPVGVAPGRAVIVMGTRGGCLEGFMCPGTRACGVGLAGEKTGLCQLGASHCGLSVVDFQAQRLYKSIWWIIKLRMTH